MVSTRLGVLLLVFVGLIVRGAAQAPSQGEAPELTQIRLNHAQALLALADEAASRRILNEEERLLLMAERASVGVVSKERNDAARARRLSAVKGDDEVAYRAVLKTRQWSTDRDGLLAKEARQVAAAVAAYAALTRTLGPDREEVAEAAWTAAYALDPADPRLAGAAGAQRMQRLRANRIAALGIGKLESGETLFGPKLGPDDLKNKVVLWRSFSL